MLRPDQKPLLPATFVPKVRAMGRLVCVEVLVQETEWLPGWNPRTVHLNSTVWPRVALTFLSCRL